MILMRTIGAPTAHGGQAAVYALVRTAAMTVNIREAVGAASAIGR